MLKKFGKGLLSLILVIIMAGLSIVEIGIEVVYQFTRMIKRVYGSALDGLLALIEPIYNGKLRIKFIHRPVKESDDIKILEFNYEEES